MFNVLELKRIMSLFINCFYYLGILLIVLLFILIIFGLNFLVIMKIISNKVFEFFILG